MGLEIFKVKMPCTIGLVLDLGLVSYPVESKFVNLQVSKEKVGTLTARKSSKTGERIRTGKTGLGYMPIQN